MLVYQKVSYTYLLCSQNCPEYPGIQWHCSPDILSSTQVALFWQGSESPKKEKKMSFKAVEFFSKKQQNKKFTLI